jgi:hypothetical protein
MAGGCSISLMESLTKAAVVNRPKIVSEWLALQFCIQEDPGLNLKCQNSTLNYAMTTSFHISQHCTVQVMDSIIK